MAAASSKTLSGLTAATEQDIDQDRRRSSTGNVLVYGFADWLKNGAQPSPPP